MKINGNEMWKNSSLSMSDIHCNDLLVTTLVFRQVSILSQLEHPHIISLVGVCMRPKPMMLLEYAQLGSLRSLHPYNHLSNQLKHRIAIQVGGNSGTNPDGRNENLLAPLERISTSELRTPL